MLTSHPDADSIHITGSIATYEAIVFGPGEEGERNKANKTPANPRPVGAELGGVGPVIVVPGKWSKADLRYQAEHIVSMKMHNAGHNCVAAQVLVLPEDWDQKDALLDEIRGAASPRPWRRAARSPKAAMPWIAATRSPMITRMSRCTASIIRAISSSTSMPKESTRPSDRRCSGPRW